MQGLGASLLLPALNSCSPSAIGGSVNGPNAALGHRLRTMNFPQVTETIRTDFVIVGGGVAGLSAARYLKKHTGNFLLLELETDAGGNAAAGSNTVSSFPWGAHYLPLPGNNDMELIEFLTTSNVITGNHNGKYTFNEYYLCHDPKERLFINHFWQDGIIPHEGVPRHDRDEIQRFLALMHAYKELKGADGKEAFAIPVCLSSQDHELLKLDMISAADFLESHDFKSPFLLWYVNYCCADDYGTSIGDTSAWAMIHYFASRKGTALNASSDSVLTWPEGNYWLVKNLKRGLEDKLRANSLVYNVTADKHGVDVLFFDASQNISKKIKCRAVIMATPQFINQRLLTGMPVNGSVDNFEYAPWMVANMTTDHPLTERRGEPLCWDNVIYGSEGLGYVNASHQELGLHHGKKVITYYRPLLGSDTAAIRRAAHMKKFDDWKDIVLNDLKKPHPEIDSCIHEMNVWIWGHGMIKPKPGFIWNEYRMKASHHIGNKIFFAHSDLSGLSVFEEAFYNGHNSARAALKS